MTPPRMPPSDDGKVYLAYAAAILRALAEARDARGEPVPGNRTRAAEALGIAPRTLDRHIEQLGLADLCGSEGQSAIWPRSARQPKRDPQPGC